MSNSIFNNISIISENTKATDKEKEAKLNNSTLEELLDTNDLIEEMANYKNHPLYKQ